MEEVRDVARDAADAARDAAQQGMDELRKRFDQVQDMGVSVRDMLMEMIGTCLFVLVGLLVAIYSAQSVHLSGMSPQRVFCAVLKRLCGHVGFDCGDQCFLSPNTLHAHLRYRIVINRPSLGVERKARCGCSVHAAVKVLCNQNARRVLCAVAAT
jgi:hypothetical protein